MLTFQQMLSIRHAPPHPSQIVQALITGILLAPSSSVRSVVRYLNACGNIGV